MQTNTEYSTILALYLAYLYFNDLEFLEILITSRYLGLFVIYRKMFINLFHAKCILSNMQPRLCEDGSNDWW